MKSFSYNDLEFSVERASGGWDIQYRKPDGKAALVAAGVFADVAESAIEDKAKVLVRSIFPVGIRIVGPDVTHLNFIYWDKNSVSFPAKPG